MIVIDATVWRFLFRLRMCVRATGLDNLVKIRWVCPTFDIETDVLSPNAQLLNSTYNTQ